MARSIWNGTITFGLIAVPIKVHSATEDRSVQFHQVHAKDGARITQKRICSAEGTEVPYEQVVKGYELRGGEFVVLSQEEIDAAAGSRAHLIALEEFVRLQQIDPVFYDSTYYLGVGDGGADAYRLLHDALRRSERVGIGRWVFHNREYLAAVRALDQLMALHTMRFADELVRGETLGLPAVSSPPSKREIETAQALVDALQAPFDPGSFTDDYRRRVLELIDAKAKGRAPELPLPEQPQEPADMVAALQASIASAKQRKAKAGR